MKFRNYKPAVSPCVHSSGSVTHQPAPPLQTLAGKSSAADDAPAAPAPAAALPTKAVVEAAHTSASAVAPAPLGTAGSSLAAVADLAPKKVNEDLKRDIQPQLDLLAARTQEAIAAMVKAKLAASRATAPDVGQGTARVEADGAALALMVEKQAEQQGQQPGP